MIKTITKFQTFLLILGLGLIFLLVYSPHFGYPLPFHIDEWHHISESIRMGGYGDYFENLRIMAAQRFSGLELGFHFVLFLFSWVLDLVSIYKFLPAIWAVLSGLALFYIVFKKTNNNFYLSFLSVIFFASIKSNVNLTGFWFFTPLTFSIPFIFLYLYFFTEGLETKNKNFILGSLFIILILIPTHSISVLFSTLILLTFMLINYKYILKNILFFVSFLIIPVVGILFYKYTLDVAWGELFSHFWEAIQFKYGWGVFEVRNSPSEVYSWAGYIFALIGLLAILFTKQVRKYLLWIVWPAILIVFIILYHITGVSFLSPYQRNFYYLALSFPFLSAFGFYSFLVFVRKYLRKFFFLSSNKNSGAINISIKIDTKYERLTLNLVSAFLIIAMLISIFAGYYFIPRQLSLYHAINEFDYNTLIFLKGLPLGRVISDPFMAATIFPITGMEPVADINFYGDKKIIEEFFLFSDCARKKEIIKDQNVKYVISPAPLECDFEVIYAQQGNIIYQFE